MSNKSPSGIVNLVAHADTVRDHFVTRGNTQ
jgi:hypothetical protein